MGLIAKAGKREDFYFGKLFSSLHVSINWCITIFGVHIDQERSDEQEFESCWNDTENVTKAAIGEYFSLSPTRCIK